MSKAVLISIKPKWCEKILNGEKTIEVRKTKPKIETPFKCYIYCTKENSNEVLFVDNHFKPMNLSYFADYRNLDNDNYIANGKVIGEFTCDWIKEFEPYKNSIGDIVQYAHRYPSIIGDDCLSFKELNNYIGDKNGYDWHITNLKIYDKPKELREFKNFIKEEKRLKTCNNNCKICVPELWCNRTITHPPQSWRYVEDLGE